MSETSGSVHLETQDEFNAWAGKERPAQFDLWGNKHLARYDPKPVKMGEEPVPPMGMTELPFE